jgi:hypothetical protein
MIIHSDLDNEENFDDSNLCRICYDEYKDDENVNDNSKCVTLKCGHKFHYECIYMTYKSLKGQRTCPYCRKDGGFLPLIPGQMPQQYIHSEYIKFKENPNQPLNIELIPNKCKYILKTGKNKDNQCKFGIKTEEGYCNMHFKKVNPLL